VFGVHRSTFYGWKRKVDRYGLEMLRPRERRRPRMPNQLSPLVEQRIVAFALAHPGFGPRRVSGELRRAKWGGLVVRPMAPGAASVGTGSTRVRGGWRSSPATARPISRRASPSPERHVEAERPGGLVGVDCFFVGRLHGTRGAVHGVRISRIRAGRPQSNGHVEALHKTILGECWRPAFARYLYLRFQGLRRELGTYIHSYNHDRAHNGRLTRGRIPADIVYGANKMKATR
jgi:hypothetical protein